MEVLIIINIKIMKIKEVRLKYPNLKISYLPKKDYVLGMERYKLHSLRANYSYDNVFLAKDMNKHYLLYPSRNFSTGHFKTRELAIDWFRKGGR